MIPNSYLNSLSKQQPADILVVEVSVATKFILATAELDWIEFDSSDPLTNFSSKDH
mgnify:CR=1 FL=1